MRVEKLAAKMEYWDILDDHWEYPLRIGIEHADGEVHAVLINNMNAGSRGVRTLNGAELLGILKAIEQCGSIIKDINPQLFYSS